MKEGKKNFFWASYADLMTSLFFVMLVLYVITYVKLRKEQEEYKVKARQLDKIKEIEKAVNEIDSLYFRYDKEHKKHVLNIEVQFVHGSANIYSLPGDKRHKLFKAGKGLEKLVTSFKKEENIKYLVIIEGQASKDGADINYPLSYQRALALVKFWRESHIKLEDLSNCELIIAGSGEKGVPREQPDIPPKNQRFLIHVIPKIGVIE